MESTRWKRIQALFHDAAELAEAERGPFLKDACGDDEGLMGDVLALLEEDSRGGTLLDRDVADVAHRVLGDALPLPVAFEELGPYRIRGVLGEGGMGVVYLADRQDLGSRVAIKILRDAWLSPARRERFASEQRMLAQLNHPSIARLYDADTLPDGTPWFVMEYVDGLPLTEYCHTRASSIPSRLLLLRSVCEAVQYAHRHAVIHRDLKPSNILVKRDGTVRLLDFGIAKQLESLDAPVDQTRTGLRLMTPAYAAPEQIRGGQVGIHTDVYSLGVILYELLAGQLPFDLSSRTPGEAATIVVERDPEKPSVVARRKVDSRRVSPQPAVKTSWADLDVLCLTAMHKDPQRRYRSIEALIRDIDHYLKGEPLEARPDTVGYRLGKFVRRKRRAVFAATLVFVTVVGLVVFFTVRLAAARNAALAEAARTQRIQRFMLKLFEGGDEAAGPADSLRVVTLVDRGVQEARNLDGEPEVQAELYRTLGNIYQQLDHFDQADSLLHSALEQSRSIYGPEHPQVAEILVALGLLRSDQARFEEAERLVRSGLEMGKRNLPPDHPGVAAASAALGKVLEERGAYDQAIEVLDEAVRLLSVSGKPTPDLAEALSELANVHFYTGHYDEADALNRRVLAMNQQLYGEGHPHVASDLINLGAIQFQRGRYDEAERFYRQGLEITEAWYGKDHHRTASALTMLGRALVAERRLDEALELLQRALAIQQRVFGAVHPRVASALNELGNLALQQGKMDDAEAQFRRMEEIYRSVYGEGHSLVALAMANRASVYLARQQYGVAERLYRDVIGRYTEALSADHLNTGIARIKLGRALVGQGRHAEAEPQILAGYEIVARQSDPKVSWLQTARKDLVTVYDALNQPEKAAKFRLELAER